MSPNDNSGANANLFSVGSDNDLPKNSNLISQQQKLFLVYYVLILTDLPIICNNTSVSDTETDTYQQHCVYDNVSVPVSSWMHASQPSSMIRHQ